MNCSFCWFRLGNRRVLQCVLGRVILSYQSYEASEEIASDTEQTVQWKWEQGIQLLPLASKGVSYSFLLTQGPSLKHSQTQTLPASGRASPEESNCSVAMK